MASIYQFLSLALQEQYDLVKPLKESSRGSVSLIRHRAGGAQFVERRFHGSGEVYRGLLEVSCPHLPQIMEVAEEDGNVLVLEEYIQGDTIDFLLQGSLFTPTEARNIALQLCRGLWVLHSMGAVHRDIKPDNVILRGKNAVLIDFDASRLYKAEREADTQILGTTGYAAPEQYGLSQSDGRADLYSLGVLLNVMLTGQHPSKKLTSGALGRIIQRCTAVNPNKRYKNVRHLMEAL